LTFLQALNHRHPHSVFSFAGGGGKSTLIYLLAQELSTLRYRVLVTTTTMIYHPDVKRRPYDRLIVSSMETILQEASAVKPGSIIVAAREKAEYPGEHKLKGFLPKEIDTLYSADIFDIILVEADGAKHLSIKAPGESEPVIPLSTSITFGIIGLDAMGSIITQKTVFRTKEFCTLTGKHEGETVDRSALVNLIQSGKGLFKNSPQQAQKIVVLNKADNDEIVQKGIETAAYILKKASLPDRIFITAGQKPGTEGPVRALLNAE